MNEQNKTIIAELRDRYAPTATPPCRICGGGLSLERAGGGSPSVWRCAGRVEGGYAPGRKIADQHYEDSEWTDYKAGGDQRVIDICDALEAAERRVAEAEARARDEVNRRIEASHDLHIRLEQTEAQTAVWREHTSALVAAMKTWGSWEDGVPDASDAGECGDVGRAFNAARDALAPDMNLKAWRCSACGETAAPMTSAWRWTGSIWQHTHTDASQAGHFDAVYVDPARALLDRLHAAEAERDEAMAVLEEIREFARTQSQGPAAPDDLWAIKEMADKLILRCAQLPGAAPAEAP